MSSKSEVQTPKVLIAIQDDDARERAKNALKEADVGVEVIAPKVDPLERVPETSADLMVIRRSKVRSEDLSRIDRHSREDEAPRLLVLRDNEEHDHGSDRVRLLAAGAAGVVEADDSRADLRAGVEAAVATYQREATGTRRPGRTEPQSRLSDFLSRSLSMGRFLDLVERVVDSDTSLLITGETGVGKERLARAIHNEGPRACEPFVAVNCGALPESLLESELFGHEAGAFTGATRRKRGRFELANGGTIFLDEIAEMPIHLQVNLLSVLQGHTIHRIGSEEAVPVDVRVMAATNRNVTEDVRKGRFREDLYYRLNVVNLDFPPLRERTEDIPDLVGVHIYRFRSDLGRHGVESISDEALEAMLRYPWPGNVRELLNAVEHAVVVCRTSQISLADLPVSVAGATSAPRGRRDAAPVGGTGSLHRGLRDLPLRDARRTVVAEVERDYLDAALAKFDGRIDETAKHSGITPRSLYDKMKRYGLRKEDYR